MKISELPEEELIERGNASCPGCGLSLAFRIAIKALGKKTVLVVPASCAGIIEGKFPKSAIDIPVFNAAFETGGSTAGGMVAALEQQKNEEATVVTWAGDGGTYDIGLQSLSGAMERFTDFVYVCYNNEAYANTGVQRSGATPLGAWTTTTETGKKERRKDMGLIVIAHQIPYIASANVSYPLDLYQKVKKAKEIKGPAYIEILAPCPPGWRFPASETIEIGKKAVDSGMWILYEVEKGKFKFNGPSEKIARGEEQKTPVEEYLKKQGRFKHLFEPKRDKETITQIEKNLKERWEQLKKMNKVFEA